MIQLYTMERDYPYGTLRSTNGAKTKVVLEEKDLEYQTVCIKPGDVWKKMPHILAKHPLGKVPYIDDGDLTLYDSTVINEYLNDLAPEPPLLPADAALRGRARALENYADEGVLMRYLPMLWMPWWSPPEKRDTAAMQKGRDGLLEQIAPFVSTELGGNDYLCGDFSLADVPFMSVAMVLQVDGMDCAQSPVFARYLERLRQRASYQAISPDTPVAAV
ncbi:MAG: glutathione S-transferase family protein [Pseudomonadales bacterium]